MAPWDEFATAPQMIELDHLAQLRGDGVGNLDCQEFWCCPDCGLLYPPTTNILVNLPEFGCSTCHTKNPTAYGWKIPQVILNGVPLDFMVYDQGESRHCVMYASVAAMDCARRVKGALHGVSKCSSLDINSALTAYAQKYGFECGEECYKSYESTYNSDTFPLVLTFLKHHGVPYSRLNEMTPNLKLKDYFVVKDVNSGRKADINLATRLIANGYPLLAGVNVGALFVFVNNMEVYNPPILERGGSAHALALIGSGIGRNKYGVLETYFAVRDSAGCMAHSNYTKQGFGGDLLIWSSDVYSIWGFHLED